MKKTYPFAAVAMLPNALEQRIPVGHRIRERLAGFLGNGRQKASIGPTTVDHGISFFSRAVDEDQCCQPVAAHGPMTADHSSSAMRSEQQLFVRRDRTGWWKVFAVSAEPRCTSAIIVGDRDDKAVIDDRSGSIRIGRTPLPSHPE